MDVSGSKLPLIQESARRLGIGIIHTRRADLLHGAALPECSFDRILVDAPCSGLGVIRRNPEAKWRLRPEDITRLAETQKRMLGNAVRMLKPGGRLLYSTCSTTREENEAVLSDFLSRHDDCALEDLNELYPSWGELFTREGMLRSWPHRHAMDGFFAARLRKR
jgi:16S rRNA (cytosine967-C5)-methyltransferase